LDADDPPIRIHGRHQIERHLVAGFLHDIDFQFHLFYGASGRLHRIATVRTSPGATVIVCHCRAATDREIRRAIRNGAVSLRELSHACGAGAGCGGCAPAVLDILQAELGAMEPRAAELDAVPVAFAR
jgi:bacterioferritin-associated ferredoxin